MQPPAAPVLDAGAQYDQLKSAVLGAQANTAPGASPLGSFPELSKLYGSSFQVPISNANAGADSARTDITVSNNKAAAAAAKAASDNSPGKWKQVLKADGGYAFYDGNGNEVSAAQYAAARNQDITTVLKHSYNPIDKAFAQDYKQLQQYINDKANAKNDPKARSRAQAVETQVRKLYNIDLHQQNPSEVINAFVQAYPTVFGGHTAGKQGTSTLFPTNNTLKSSSSSSVPGL